MNKFCNISIQRLCTFSGLREKRKTCDKQAALTLCLNQRLCTGEYKVPFRPPAASSGPLIFPLLPTPWQVGFKTQCLIRKSLRGACQRCLSEVLSHLSPLGSFPRLRMVLASPLVPTASDAKSKVKKRKKMSSRKRQKGRKLRRG